MATRTLRNVLATVRTKEQHKEIRSQTTKKIRTSPPNGSSAPSLRGSIIITKSTLGIRERVLPSVKNGTATPVIRFIQETVGRYVEIVRNDTVHGIFVVSPRVASDKVEVSTSYKQTLRDRNTYRIIEPMA